MTARKDNFEVRFPGIGLCRACGVQVGVQIVLVSDTTLAPYLQTAMGPRLSHAGGMLLSNVIWPETWLVRPEPGPVDTAYVQCPACKARVN